MTRPNAAYVGMGLSHPIRLVMNRGLHVNVAKLLSVTEACELVEDLTSAIQRAREDKKPTTRVKDPRYENCPECSTRAADDDDHVGGTG